jgi:hypothetical protein
MPEGRDGLARDPAGGRSDRNTPPQEQHWASDWSSESFDAVPPPPRVGRGHRTTAENMAGRELLGSYGAHIEHLTESAMSATVGQTPRIAGPHPRGAVEEVAKRNSQLEFMKDWGRNRYIGDEYVEEGTEGQFQSASDLTGGRFGRLASQTGSVTAGLNEVFGGNPSSMSGFTTPLAGSSHNPPPPSQTATGRESYPAFSPLPPGAIRPPNQ